MVVVNYIYKKEKLTLLPRNTQKCYIWIRIATSIKYFK